MLKTVTMNKMVRIGRWKNFFQSKMAFSTKNFEFMANKGFKTQGNISLSSGIFGHLSESSVICRAGDSVVHASVNSARSQDPKDAFLPLTVDYRSRQYAFGAVPLTKNRREMHNSQDEVLVARFIDRAVRPLFPKGYVNEVQITVTSHAADGIHDPTVAAVNAASFALMKSKQPWSGPIGCVRVGLVDGQLKVDPSLAEMETSSLDFLYAGTASRTLMIETAASQVPDATIKQALRLAHNAVQDIISAQRNFIDQESAAASLAGVAQSAVETVSSTPSLEAPLSIDPDEDSEVVDTVAATLTSAGTTSHIPATSVYGGKRLPFEVSAELKSAVWQLGHQRAMAMYAAGGVTKADRGAGEGKLRGELLQALAADPVWSLEHIVTRKMAVDSVLNGAFRSVLLDGSARIDGRTINTLRDISSAVEVMPSVHGSSYFARGDTHVLSTVTLGSKTDSMKFLPINGASSEEREAHFLLHYDFPPYCTGEMGNATALNRRMTGHGKLAEKAIRAVMPSVETFPYTVRVYSECTSSNGSSSMASACSASLALMDAGVPISAPVAGLSVGLITHSNLTQLLPALEALKCEPQEGAEVVTDSASALAALGEQQRPYVLLKDILGTEDHNGDMDFKIAGTAEGVTAIQLDVKLAGGVPLFMLEEALDVAAEGRAEILATMSKTIAAPNNSVKSHAPKAVLMKIDPERKLQLTGQGGEMIKYIQELYSCDIDTTVEGFAYIFGRNAKSVADARSLVQDIAVLVKEGDVLSAQVLDVKDFGVTVKINRAQEALLHQSEISHDPELLKRPVSELFEVGQRLEVKVYSVDKGTGIIKVSRKQLLNPKSAGPDRISHLSGGEAEHMQELPTFPVVPPRKFSREFFSTSVVSNEEVATAMKTHQLSIERARHQELEAAAKITKQNTFPVSTNNNKNNNNNNNNDNYKSKSINSNNASTSTSIFSRNQRPRQQTNSQQTNSQQTNSQQTNGQSKQSKNVARIFESIKQNAARTREEAIANRAERKQFGRQNQQQGGGKATGAFGRVFNNRIGGAAADNNRQNNNSNNRSHNIINISNDSRSHLGAQTGVSPATVSASPASAAAESLAVSDSESRDSSESAPSNSPLSEKMNSDGRRSGGEEDDLVNAASISRFSDTVETLRRKLNISGHRRFRGGSGRGNEREVEYPKAPQTRHQPLPLANSSEEPSSVVESPKVEQLSAQQLPKQEETDKMSGDKGKKKSRSERKEGDAEMSEISAATASAEQVAPKSRDVDQPVLTTMSSVSTNVGAAVEAAQSPAKRRRSKLTLAVETSVATPVEASVAAESSGSNATPPSEQPVAAKPKRKSKKDSALAAAGVDGLPSHSETLPGQETAAVVKKPLRRSKKDKVEVVGDSAADGTTVKKRGRKPKAVVEADPAL